MSMSIGPVSQRMVSFGQQPKYENPVNKKMEYYGTAIASVAGSTLVGGAAAAIAHSESFGFAIKNKYIAAGIGVVAGLATLALTLPSAIYHKSVQAFAKEKEFDVYSRAKSAETSLSEQIDEQARNPEVSLEDSINNFAKFNIARGGRGLGIYGM